MMLETFCTALDFDVPLRTVVMEVIGAAVGVWACVLVVRERNRGRAKS